jgi:hypothetical protein
MMAQAAVLKRIAAHLPDWLVVKLAAVVLPLLAAAGCPMRKDGSFAPPSRAVVQQQPAAQPGGVLVDCALDGAAHMAPACRKEVAGDIWVLTRPDGVVHRLRLTHAGLVPADGAVFAAAPVATLPENGAMRLTVGRDVYRIVP